jgi:hypothetical protein
MNLVQMFDVAISKCKVIFHINSYELFRFNLFRLVYEI